MTASQVRAEARQKLAKKWGKSALMTLVFVVATYIISFVLALIPYVGSILSTLISVPISYGFIVSMMKLNDDTETGCFDFLNNGFSKFGKSWKVSLWIFVKLIIPVILIIITAVILSYGEITQNNAILTLGFILYFVALIYTVIKQLSYNLAYFVLTDNPDMKAKEAVEKSAELMKGKVWSLFCLNLSFIGWAILSVFTLCIGLFWLIPYMRVSEINFYRNLVGEPTVVE